MLKSTVPTMTASPASPHSPGDHSLPSPMVRRARHFAAVLIGFIALGVLATAVPPLWESAGPWGTMLIFTLVVLIVGGLLETRRRRRGAAVRPENRPYVVTGLLSFCLAAWLATTLVGLTWASIQSWTLFGAEPSPERLERGRLYLLQTLGAGAAIAVPGLALAAWQRRPGWFAVFAILAATMVIALLITLVTG
jgi:peptidoglycan/LPS O-acetylase OafA/YrhL